MHKVRLICILTILSLALFAIAPAAMADPETDTITRTGEITLAHGAHNVITATAAPCDPTSPLTGLDGVWYRIPQGATQVTLDPNYLLDADLLFYKFAPGASSTAISALNNSWVGGSCVGAGSPLFDRGYGYSVFGPIPPEATYVLVNGWLGTGCFNITFS